MASDHPDFDMEPTPRFALGVPGSDQGRVRVAPDSGSHGGSTTMAVRGQMILHPSDGR